MRQLQLLRFVVDLLYTVSQKKNCASVIFLNNSVKHWPILITKKIDVND